MISAEQQSDSVIHIFFFHILFPLSFIIGLWTQFPFLYSVCLLSRFSLVQLFATLWTTVASLLSPWISPGKNTGEGCRAFLQVILLTQGLNPHLLCLPALAGGFFTTSAIGSGPCCLFALYVTICIWYPNPIFPCLPFSLATTSLASSIANFYWEPCGRHSSNYFHICYLIKTSSQYH